MHHQGEERLSEVEAAEVPEPPEQMNRYAEADRRRALRIKALQLRMGGLAYHEIAEQLHVSRHAVADLIDGALAGAEIAQRETIVQMRDLENTRLDRLQAAYWSKALRGDQRAFDNVLKVHDRRSRLNGLAAPTQVNLNVSIRAEMEAALAELETVLGEVIESRDDDDDDGEPEALEA